jgi:hypothetical protein
MDNQQKGDFQSFGSIFTQKKKKAVKKPPAYGWQDLALKIIAELGIPGFKRSSIFKICRDNPKEFAERCLNDTKELCKSGESWKYFLKVVNEEGKKNKPEI